MPMRKIWNNQYEQLRKIGEGASGRVMLARDLHLNRLVAIKEMEQIREIRREMELLKALKHPGLPDIYDYFEEDRHGFLVMEYVEGVTLKEYLEQHGKPELTQAIVWMKELLDILVYLHEQHPAVVYRDLKPANLIIQEEGHLKLIDLGGAFFRCHNQSEERVSIGTPGYSAPEQWNGIQADVSCDIFSFGAFAHELLTGVNPLKPPYERRPVRRYDRRIPVSYEQMIQKCTREHPKERYASMREVLTRRFSHGLEEARTLEEKGMDTSFGSFTRFPDLLMMDGGRGQVNIALEVLGELGLEIPVCGMVKDDNHRTRGLYYNNVEVPIDRHSEGFRLITRIQDEAHRFAIEYHRSLRAKGQVKSILDDIPDIGPARRKALMRQFQSLEAVKEATLEALMEVPGMNRKSAESVYQFFH